MKTSSLLLSVMTGVLLSGCAPTRYVDVNGERFQMLSEKEEQELVEHARVSMGRLSSRLSPREKRQIETTPPEVRFFYAADRYGRAVVRWHLPTREVGVDYAGEFLGKHMSSSLYSREKMPELIDLTKQAPPDRTGRTTNNTGRSPRK